MKAEKPYQRPCRNCMGGNIGDPFDPDLGIGAGCAQGRHRPPVSLAHPLFGMRGHVRASKAATPISESRCRNRDRSGQACRRSP